MSKEEQKIDPVKESEKTEKPKSRPKHHVRGIWAMTLILTFSALLITTVWVYVILNKNKEIVSMLNFQQLKSQKAQKTEAAAKKGLKTYTNLSALFLFDYPDTWALAEKNNTIYLSSDADYPQKYIEGTMPEMKDTDIYIQIHFSNQTIDISREEPAIKPKFSTINIGGVDAKRITYKDDTNYSDLVQNFQVGDFYFLIIADTKSANVDKIEAYNKMLGSFKFGNEVIKEAG